ncbi:MAG: NUDIX hydrolase [Luteibaculaceae bacterium]
MELALVQIAQSETAIKEALKFSVDARVAHQEIASYARPSWLEVKDKNNYKESGVLCLLSPLKTGEWGITLTQRHVYKGVHSGQVSFPGGKIEEHETVLEAAIRETYEEVGVEKNLYSVEKALTPVYIPPSNFMVNPFVGVSSVTLNYKPQVEEVAEVFELPLAEFLKPTILTQTQVFVGINQLKMQVPCFSYNGKIIWGATAMILNELRHIFFSYAQWKA